MTKCKSCNKDIADGLEYCDDCAKDNQDRLSESYLDSLLNSVADINGNKTPNVKRENLRKSSATNSMINSNSITDKNPIMESILAMDSIPTVDNESNLDTNSVMDSNTILNSNSILDNNTTTDNNAKTDNNATTDNNTTTDSNTLLDNTITEKYDEGTIIKDIEQNELNINNNDDLDIYSQEESEKDIADSQDDDLMSLLDMITGLENSNSKKYSEIPFDEDESPISVQETNETIAESKPQDNIFIVEDDTIHFINDLDFDGTANQDTMNEIDDIDSLSDFGNTQRNDINSQIDIDSIHNLGSLKEINSLDDLKVETESNETSDIFSIDDFIDDKLNDISDNSTNSSDFSNVFSNSISALDTLEDKNSSEIQQVKKKSLFQKLFGPPEEKEDTKKETKLKPKKSKKKDISTETDDDSTSVEGKKKKAKKKNSKVKETKNKAKNTNIEEEDSENTTELNKKGKKGQKNTKFSSKEDRKAKKNNKKAQDVILDELEMDEEVKINKIGASIIFVFCGIVAVIVIVGANLFSYSLSIGKASTEFNRGRYTEAYNQIYGLDVHSSDKELYDKIMTVMYVNKQLNSYYNYLNMGKRPEALDSLLKGLVRYETNIDVATSLEVNEDLDFVRSHIVTELEKQFNITEEEGLELINSTDQLYYSNQIFDIATKN